MYALHSLLDQRLRLALTVGGVALCVVLILFLGSVYEGVRVGSVEYVRASKADLWVLQRHTTNILRATSILPEDQGAVLRSLPGIASASPVLFLMGGIEREGGASTLYVTGFDPRTGRGGPPHLAAGRPPERPGEIVLDRAFALGAGLGVSDTVRMGDTTLCVTGLSTGTNMFVMQYAFTTLDQAQTLAGLPGIVSTWLVALEPETDVRAASAAIRTLLGVEVYDHATFVRNNVHEMESGLLPLLFAVAVLGAVVLASILSLILSVNVLERRGDYAVMKALGAPGLFVPRLVVAQALWISGLALAFALALFFPLLAGLAALAPEIEPRATASQTAAVAGGMVLLALLASLLPVQRVRRIYALEVFR